MSNKIDIRMTKAMVQLLIKHRFYGVLAQHLMVVEEPLVESMATDGVHLWYDPAFLDKLSADETKGVIAHELMHCAYRHHTRRKTRDPILWNIACDYSINMELVNAGFTLPKDAIMSYDYYDKSAEEIYTHLLKNAPPVKKVPWGIVKEPGNAKAKAKSDVEWRIRIKQAASVAGRGIGKTPAGIERLLDSVNKAVVDWRSELRRFFDDQVITDTLWSKPNKRYLDYGFILPGPLKEGVKKIGVVLDTSGSINDNLLKQFYGEVQDLMDTGLVGESILICCDAAVCGKPTTYYANEIIDMKPMGRGGTRFSPAIEWFNKHEPDISTLIYLTDLECYDYGSAPEYKVLWCAYGPESSLDKAAVPFGEIIKMMPEGISW